MFGRPSMLIAAVFCIAVPGDAARAASPAIASPSPQTGTVNVGREFTPNLPTSIATPAGLENQRQEASHQSPQDTTGSDGIQMGAAERLQIKFQGLTDLTGEYRLSPDGSISLPVLGRIHIATLSAAELEKLLAERVARVTSRDAFVTVEIIEYRPVFVSGFVAKPGAFPWRPGMNILQAVALAGGTFRNVGESGSGLQDSAELERLQKAIAGQARNLAIRGRLDAELKDADSIEMPALLVSLVGKAAANDFIKQQTTELLNRKAGLEAKRASIAKALETTHKEILGLTQQSARLGEQLNIRVKYKKQIDDLQTRGLARADRAMEELSKVSDLEDRSVSLAVGTARLQAIVAQLERDEANLEHERKADVGTEMFKLGRDIAQLDIEIDTARMNYKKITGQDPSMTLDTQKKAGVRYEIVRSLPSGSASLVSDPLAPMKPGDVLLVALD